jgi:hypothetical protein
VPRKVRQGDGKSTITHEAHLCMESFLEELGSLLVCTSYEVDEAILHLPESQCHADEKAYIEPSCLYIVVKEYLLCESYQIIIMHYRNYGFLALV